MSTQTLTQNKTISINGENFYDLDSFYAEMKNVMAKDLEWNPSRNLHGLHDLLSGGFGALSYKEPFTLIWVNSEISQSALDFPSAIKFTDDLTSHTKHKTQALFNVLIDIIKSHPHIELVLA